MLARSILLAAASLMWPATVVAQTAGAPLVLEAKIPLGPVSGRIDHLGIDVKRQRLFVAELGNNSLGVIDLAAGKVLRRIDGLSEPQGVAYVPFTTPSCWSSRCRTRDISSGRVRKLHR